MLGKPGEKVLLMSNEAIARGAIESGLDVAAAYPGTPSSEIGAALARVADKFGFYFEYSANEKVAMEVALAAAVSGLYSMTMMKHVGLNVASDTLLTLAYTGVKGAMVIVTADDPSCHSSQNEQDNRYYGLLGNLPVIEPSTPQECLDFTRYAFQLSHELELPVLLRTTTRVNHTSADVVLGDIQQKHEAKFTKEPTRFVTVPAVARARRLWLLEQMKKAWKIAEECEFNRVSGDGKLGVITSGVAYTYLSEYVSREKLECAIFKLGFTNPLPENRIVEFIKKREQVIICEELEPVLETRVRAIAQKHGLNQKIHGKMDGYFPFEYEFNYEVVAKGVGKVIGKPHIHEKTPSGVQVPPRPPVLCAGCPHRATYYAIRKVTKGKAIFSSDIGCYTLGIQPPLEMADLLTCMGASIGNANGLSKVNPEPVFAFIGDSTFFHAGIPALLNAVHNGHSFITVIMDNSTTAMTGHQPHPGLPLDALGKEAKAVSIEALVRGCGVDYVKVVDAVDIPKAVEVYREALQVGGVRVVISRSPCALLVAGEKRKKGEKIGRYFVSQECRKCYVCINQFACPAFYIEGEEVRINDGLCLGCGACTHVCPFGAIKGGD
ncbi:MAG: indolepyruvate ferredoxin oxidoreductase subunit alpha [Thermoplasmata archaeon]|nr:indolepyruvate ferredoxin oxidoreductase subunit alpha [Thermoplasmata archaeon]